MSSEDESKPRPELERTATGLELDPIFREWSVPPPAAPTHEERSRGSDEGQAVKEDATAEAALRMIRARKPRNEEFTWVGDDPSALNVRMELLLELAEQSTGAVRAHLLVSAAEIAEEREESQRAYELYSAAHLADRNDLSALRALRAHASAQGGWQEVADLLQTEAQLPLSPAERSQAWIWLAEVQLHRLQHASLAETAAREALKIVPSSFVAMCLGIESCCKQNNLTEAMVFLESAVETCHDPHLRQILLLEIALSAERSEKEDFALRTYERALQEDPALIVALLGVMRCARKISRHEKAASACSTAAALIEHVSTKEAFLAHSAALRLYGASEPKEILRTLAQPTTPAGLAMFVEIAQRTRTLEALPEALERWAEHSGGQERALLLITLADVYASLGRSAEVARSLNQAVTADERLYLVRHAREILVHLHPQLEVFWQPAEAQEPADPQRVWSQLARRARLRESYPQQKEQLTALLDSVENRMSADVLGMDIALELGDIPFALRTVSRFVQRAQGTAKIPYLLSLADLRMWLGDREGALGELRLALEISPKNPLLLRELGAFESTRSEDSVASFWLEEAAMVNADRAGFAYRMAGFGLRPAQALGLLKKAFDYDSSYLPLAWMLEQIARSEGDVGVLCHLHETLGQISSSSHERAARLGRAALLLESTDLEHSKHLFSLAFQTTPNDLVLLDACNRVDQAIPAEVRAEKFAELASSSAPPWQRIYKMLAASLYARAHDARKSSELLQTLLQDSQEDFMALVALHALEQTQGDAHVGQRLFDHVRQASTPQEKIAAWEELAQFDRDIRHDVSSSVLALQSILELDPTCAPALYALEHYFLEHNRYEDLLFVEESLTKLVQNPKDASSHLRLAARIHAHLYAAEPETTQSFVVALIANLPLDNWAARKLMSAAQDRSEVTLAARALNYLIENATDPHERTAWTLRLSEHLEKVNQTGQAVSQLSRAVIVNPEYPYATEQLGDWHASLGHAQHAAEAYELAADSSRSHEHALRLWESAATLWQDSIHDEERALKAWLQVLTLDGNHPLAHQNLPLLLRKYGQHEPLRALLQSRLEGELSPAAREVLLLELSEIDTLLGALPQALESLRAILEINPDHKTALLRMTELSTRMGDWASTAEAWIRVARVSQDPSELKSAFFALGGIYDVHLPDSERAKWAYRHLLKLDPGQRHIMECLVNLHRKDGELVEAAEMISDLLQSEPNLQKAQAYRFELAHTWEAAGERKKAEIVLEEARRVSPLDTQALVELARFYQRSQSTTALQMHLNRALSDARQAVSLQLEAPRAWLSLVEALSLRDQPDAVRCVLSAATTLGIHLEHLTESSPKDLPGLSGTVFNEKLNEWIRPSLLTPSVWTVFSETEEVLNKNFPVDFKALGTERISKRNHAWSTALATLQEWTQISEVQLRVSSQLPHAFFPTSSEPYTFVIGTKVWNITHVAEQLFLLLYGTKIAQARLSFIARNNASVLMLVLGALGRLFDPLIAIGNTPVEDVERLSNRFAKALNQRTQDAIMANVMEIVSGSTNQTLALIQAVREFGHRAGYLGTGSLTAALAVLRHQDPKAKFASHDTKQKLDWTKQSPEAYSLIQFVLSDNHFDIRRKFK